MSRRSAMPLRRLPERYYRLDDGRIVVVRCYAWERCSYAVSRDECACIRLRDRGK